MSHAAGNLRLQNPATSSSNLTPYFAALATPPSGSGHHDLPALEAACAEIFKRWRRFLNEHDARAEAERFRQRFESLATARNPTDSELDATLARVADAMAAA